MKILVDATTTQNQFATRGIGITTRKQLENMVQQSVDSDRNDLYLLMLFNAPSTLGEFGKVLEGY